MILLEERAILAIEGEDKFTFLQGLITSDITPLQNNETPVIYGAMLTPQGKIRFDFFLFQQDDTLLMDVAANQLNDIRKTLKLYKLRAQVTLTERPDLAVIANLQNTSDMPQDPRLPAMGHRNIVARESLLGAPFLPELTYHAKRISLGIPDSIDFIADRAFTAEYGLEYLNGVSFSKGCYIGQEIVSRTKHRGTVHKTLHKVEAAPGAILPEAGTPITAGEKEIGQLRSSAEHQGVAIIRRDKLANATDQIMAGTVELNHISSPEWFD